jgi:K+/H+ antiporter YhaU regulatory subunit KhtT
MLTGPGSESSLEAGDIAIVYGTPEDITNAVDLFAGPVGS